MADHMFSVHLRLVDEWGVAPEETWTIVCDRCGRELADANPPLIVVKVPDFDQLQAHNPEAAEAFAERMRELTESRSVARAIVVDAEYEVERIGGGVQAAMVAHAARCVERAKVIGPSACRHCLGSRGHGDIVGGWTSCERCGGTGVDPGT